MSGESRTTGRARNDEFEQLLSQCKVQLFGFIFCMVRTTADAEDVFQQAAMTMWNKFDEFERGSDFLAWASTVARYKALEFLRSKQHAPLQCFSEGFIDELPEQRLWTSEALEQRLDALQRCRQKLSATNQRLLDLCYDGRNTMGEVAELLSRPVESIYVSLSRVRRALYTCIQEYLAAEGQA